MWFYTPPTGVNNGAPGTGGSNQEEQEDDSIGNVNSVVLHMGHRSMQKICSCLGLMSKNEFILRAHRQVSLS